MNATIIKPDELPELRTTCPECGNLAALEVGAYCGEGEARWRCLCGWYKMAMGERSDAMERLGREAMFGENKP